MSERYQAIVIGNSKFPDLPELRCPLNDARGMAEMLRSEVHGPYEVAVLENENHDKIYLEIFRALKRATRNDRVLIYYAGHGKVDEGDSNLYLAAGDTLVDYLPASSVAVADILRHMSTSASRQLILILDCCYSGAVDKLLNSPALYRGGEIDQIDANLRPAGGSGSYILTASTSLQRAEEREGDDHGLLTKHLIAGIREGHADRDDNGLVSMHELTAYVQDQVQAEGRQKPQCFALREEDGGLIIAKTGKAARSRKLAEVQEGIYERAAERRASLRTVRASLNLLVPEPWWSAEEKAGSDLFVDRLHGSLRDGHRFIEVLEEAPMMVSAFTSGSRAAQLALEHERDGLLEQLNSARMDFAESIHSSNGLTVRCTQAEAALQALSTRSDELLEESTRQAAELKAGKKQLEEAERRRAAAEANFGAAAKEIGELREKERLLAKREKELKAELAEEHRLRGAATKEAQALKQGLSEAGRRLDDVSTRTQKAERDRERLSTELAQERQRGTDIQRELDTRLEEMIELAAKLKAAEDNESRVREELSAQLEEERKKLAAAEAELSPLKKQATEGKEKARRTPAKPAVAKRANQREESVLALLRKFKGEEDYYVYPAIPASKHANARQKCKVAIDSKTLALINCTVFGSAKDCILFDQERVYWHSMGDGDSILYSNISTSDGAITYKGNWNIVLDCTLTKKEISLAGSNFKRDKLIELLKSLYWNWIASQGMAQK